MGVGDRSFSNPSNWMTQVLTNECMFNSSQFYITLVSTSIHIIVTVEGSCWPHVTVQCTHPLQAIWLHCMHFCRCPNTCPKVIYLRWNVWNCNRNCTPLGTLSRLKMTPLTGDTPWCHQEYSLICLQCQIWCKPFSVHSDKKILIQAVQMHKHFDLWCISILTK